MQGQSPNSLKPQQQQRLIHETGIGDGDSGDNDNDSDDDGDGDGDDDLREIGSPNPAISFT